MGTYSAMARICESAWTQKDHNRRVKHYSEVDAPPKKFLLPTGKRTDSHEEYQATWLKWSLRIEKITGMRVASRDPNFELTDGRPSHNITIPPWFVDKLFRIEKKIKKGLV